MYSSKLLATVPIFSLAAAVPILERGANFTLSSFIVQKAGNGVGSVVTNSVALSFYNPDATGPAGPTTQPQYVCYSGPASSFPSMSSWIDFEDMWNINSVNQLNFWPLDTPSVQADMKASILSVSAQAKVDARFILAVIMQESTGNVGVICTNNGVENCGLMQASAGSVSFDPNNPAGSIQQMVVDGTQGTSGGAGYVQLLNGGSGLASTGGNPYAAARAYNSGSIDGNNLSNGITSTASYVSDIANRLAGWDGNGAGSSVCGFTNDPSGVTSSPGGGGSGGSGGSGSGGSGGSGTCSQSVTVVSGDTCYNLAQEFGITLAQLESFNPQLDSSCDIFPGQVLCVAESSSGSGSSGGSGGSGSSCPQTVTVVSGDTCYNLAQQFGISLSQLESMNPQLDSACDIFPGQVLCV